MQFQILDEKRYPLKIATQHLDLLPYWRYEHRATLGYNTREFMVFIDNLKQTAHIEEITGGHLATVDDDFLHESLINFSQEHHLLDFGLPIFKTDAERFV